MMITKKPIGRFHYIDIAKGILILLVILYHVFWTIVLDRGINNGLKANRLGLLL